MKTVLRISVACVCLILSLAAYSGSGLRRANGMPQMALAAGGGGEVPREELKPVAISAFKNGLAFVVRQGDAHLTNGSGIITPIPAATLGTLWLAPNDSGTSLDEVVAYRTRVPRARDIQSMAELLMANTGKTLTVFDGQKQEYTGEIVAVEVDKSVEPMNRPDAAIYPPIPRGIPEILILKSGGKLLALHLRSIDHVILPADPVLQATSDEEQAALRFKIKGASTHANLTMGYLEKGFGWTPSYLVSLEDDKTAQITMQAVVVNDAESVRDADLFFVVGVPNFQYSDTPSPMSLQQSLLDFMQSAARRDSMKDSPYSNALMAQKSAMAAAEVGGVASFATAVEDLQGTNEEDLFLYTRKGVTLAKGERGMYTVFTASVPYEHIYQWDVQDLPRVDAFGNVQQQNAYRTETAPLNNVWHSIRLKNSTKYPWTSAPATVMSAMKPLAQDTLPYAPKTSSSNLRLTIAADVRTSSKEIEVDRQQTVQQPRRGYNYDAVTVEGRLKIKNYKSKEIRVGISKTMRGTVLSQSDNGTSEKVGEALSVDNPMSHMSWEIQLKPGEERTVTYRYKIMVHV